MQFHAVPAVERGGVILPPGTLERLERHSIGAASARTGSDPPGNTSSAACSCTGRRAPARPVGDVSLAAMPGRTTILLTGRGLGLIEQALAIGRDLAPATFVFEDIDLVAAERTMEFGSQGAPFELLNIWRDSPRTRTCCSC